MWQTKFTLFRNPKVFDGCFLCANITTRFLYDVSPWFIGKNKNKVWREKQNTSPPNSSEANVFSEKMIYRLCKCTEFVLQAGDHNSYLNITRRLWFVWRCYVEEEGDIRKWKWGGSDINGWLGTKWMLQWLNIEHFFSTWWASCATARWREIDCSS